MASTSPKPDVSKLISELRSLKDATFTDEAQRKELYAILKEASLAIEAPLESVNRISFAVCFPYGWSALQYADLTE
jgi:hypothetical protein